MKELYNILAAYKEASNSNKKVALASVVDIEGSSYRRIGARMLLFEDGHWIGGISGGCLEGDVLRHAKMVMQSGKSKVITYDTREEDPYQIGVGLGCKGKIDIFIESLQNDATDTLFKSYSALINHRAINGISLVLNETDNEWGLKMGARFFWNNPAQQEEKKNGNHCPNFIKEDIAKACQEGKSTVTSYPAANGALKILHEVFQPRIHLIIVGSYYDIPPLMKLAKVLFWEITLVTNMAKAGKEMHELADQLISIKDKNVLEHLKTDTRTGVLLMSHDFATDLKYLNLFLQSDVPFIGALGPRKRFGELEEGLMKSGYPLSEYDLERIHSPLGLDIGGENPEEIALSIAAGIKAFFAHKDGRPLKLKQGTIYSRDRV